MKKIKFNELELSKDVLKGIEKMGYVSPSPIQEKTIPLLLEGKDPLREGRIAFYKEYLMPINRQTATDNIYSAIEKLYI